MTLILTIDQEASIRQHATRDYPGECCGALIGETIGAGSYVRLAVPLSNRHEDGPDRRFRIAGADLLQVEKIARRGRLNIVGFYHSHPDVPAVPSNYDREHAWEDYSYLIVETANGEPVSFRSWKLDLDAGRFNEENVQVSQCILEKSAEAQVQKLGF